MAGESHFAVAVHTNGRSPESTHRNTGLMKGGYARQQTGAEGSRGRWRERSARQDGAEWRAFIGFDRDPQAVRIGAPRQHRRKRWMPVLEEPLNARYSRRGFGGRHRDFVHDHGFSALEDGLPALARSRCNQLDQLRLGLALWHIWGPW
jgi:hypothetical protein